MVLPTSTLAMGNDKVFKGKVTKPANNGHGCQGECAQYTYQGIASLQWMGDAKLPQFFKQRWKAIIMGMLVPLDDRILCDILLERIRPTKKLQ